MFSPLLYIPLDNMSKRHPERPQDVMCAKRKCMSLSIRDKAGLLHGIDSEIHNTSMNKNSEHYSNNNQENFSVEAKISLTE
jgi:hypothetical protein